MGPLGFEPRTDGLKVSGSSLKTAPKQPQKTGKLQGNRPPSRYKMATMATPKKRGGMQASGQKSTHVLI